MSARYGLAYDYGANNIVPGSPRELAGELITLRSRYGGEVATAAALTALTADYRDGGMLVKLADGSFWHYVSASAASATTNVLVPDDAPATGRWLRLTPGGGTVVATLTALKAITAAVRYDGMTAQISADSSNWRFDASSSVTGENFFVATPAAGTGRWLRTDKFVDLKIAIDKTMADAAVLYTVPTGFRLRPTNPFWEVGTAWSGGSSSAIGLSTSNAAGSTKGDLLGGSAGDVAATLLAAAICGTIGTTIGAPALVLVAGNTIRYDKITSTFTAGDGYAHIPVNVVAT